MKNEPDLFHLTERAHNGLQGINAMGSEKKLKSFRATDIYTTGLIKKFR